MISCGFDMPYEMTDGNDFDGQNHCVSENHCVRRSRKFEFLLLILQIELKELPLKRVTSCALIKKR